MPIRKPRLSRDKIAKYSDCLRQLQDEGIDVESLEECQENPRVIDILVAGTGENTVFETRSGGVAYAVFARLVAVRPGLVLTDWGLSTDYDEQIVPESFDTRKPVCKLGGQEFRAREVLNPRIEDNLCLSSGQIVEGWLLASGLRRVPIEYGDFAVPFEIMFWDQFGNEYRTNGKLSVLRKAQWDNAGVRQGTGLDGLAATGEPRQLSLSEESCKRYLKLVADELKEKNRGKATAGTKA